MTDKEQKKGYSRRSFLKGSAVAALGVAAGSVLAGCNAGTQDAAPTADWLPESWDYETDVLVIGYGGAGLWAALTAKDEGGAEVLVLEKSPLRGGGSSSLNGMGGFTWVEDIDKGVKFLTNVTRGLTPQKVVRAYVEECQKNLDYAKKWGLIATVQPAGTVYNMLNGSDGLYQCTLAQREDGASVWTMLDEARANLGIEVIFNCHDEALIQNPATKEIVGTYVTIGNDVKTVKARRGTIITTGGFDFNEDLKNKYLRCYPAKGFYSWIYNTGDGIGMVEKVGAQLWNMHGICGGECAWFAENPQPYGFMANPRSNNFIYINRLGKRWRNEKAFNFVDFFNGWHGYTKFNEEIVDFENIPTWVIMDQNVIGAGPIGSGHGMAGSPKELGVSYSWSADNSYEIKNGWLKKADTIEELVGIINKHMESQADGWQVIGLDPAVVKATVDTYNGYCDAGNDPDFGRPAETLLKIKTGPFYAYPLYPAGSNTLGGAKHDEFSRVVDIGDNPIPRLYAGGSFGNSTMHTYGVMNGNNTENAVWGRIAARHVSALEPWDA